MQRSSLFPFEADLSALETLEYEGRNALPCSKNEEKTGGIGCCLASHEYPASFLARFPEESEKSDAQRSRV